VAQFYHKQGLYSAAKLHYSLALRLDPSFAHARMAREAVTTLAGIFNPDQEKGGVENSPRENPEMPQNLPSPEVSNPKETEPIIQKAETDGTVGVPSDDFQPLSWETRNSSAGGAEALNSPTETDGADSGVSVAAAPSIPPQKGETVQVALPRVGKLSMEKAGIEVSNGNGVNGMARRVGRYLGKKGMSVQRLTNASHFNYRNTKIYYQNGYQEVARQLAEQISECKNIEERKTFDRPSINIKLLLGKDILSNPALKGGKKIS